MPTPDALPTDAARPTASGPAYDVRRSDVAVLVEGTRLAVWWYGPDGAPAPGPAVVMGHGLGGVRQGELDRYARLFCAAGLRVALFDYRTFGDSGGWPRQVLSVVGQQADWRAVIASPAPPRPSTPTASGSGARRSREVTSRRSRPGTTAWAPSWPRRRWRTPKPTRARSATRCGWCARWPGTSSARRAVGRRTPSA